MPNVQASASLVASEAAFTQAQLPARRPQHGLPRFVAGMRALFALLGGIALVFGSGAALPPLLGLVALLYMLLSALLLLRMLDGLPSAAAPGWLWVDALVLVIVCQGLQENASWLGMVCVVPVVATALMSGARHAVAMALASAAAMLWIGERHWLSGQLPVLSLAVPVAVLALGPAAAFLALPNRRLRQRELLLEEFNRRSDPRQGLLHHVDVLLKLLDAHFGVSIAVISLRGPEPRIFRRGIDGRTQLLEEPEATLWRTRRQALDDHLGYLCTSDAARPVVSVNLGAHTRMPPRLKDDAREVLLALGPQTLALPVMSYGKPLGHLCITREAPSFTVDDLQWLHDTMREVLPLLERSDLLEQLQRATAAAERERIGRDLHDSAVQPYLGIKYGLEALARQAAGDNPLRDPIHQLLELTTHELQTLRDVVSGLRDGHDPLQATTFVAALHRQIDRFEALYGLKVQIDASPGLQLRGSAAKAVLHMVNEGLTNARRHTHATSVDVSLTVAGGNVELRLRNDHGPATRACVTDITEEFIPRSLNERAIEFGGGVCVQRGTDFTEIIVTLPMMGALA